MTALPATQSDSDTSASTPQQRLVASKLPDWVANASKHTHDRLRASINKPVSWFEAACQTDPMTVKALAQDYALHREYEAQARALLKPLPKLEHFASRRLTQAIHTRFGVKLNVVKTYLINASKAAAYKLSLDKDGIVDGQRALKLATQSLLRCAMQNFEASETQAKGLDTDSLQSVIVDSDEFVFLTSQGNPVAIAPEQFAALSRELDIGGQYQALIDAIYHPKPSPNQVSSTAYDVRQTFKRAEQSAFRVHVHLAYLQKNLSKDMYQALLTLATEGKANYRGDPLACNFLTLWKRALTGALIIGARPYRGVLVSYLPGAPIPLKEHSSPQALSAFLRDQLWAFDLAQLKALMPARYKGELSQKLLDLLRPLKWDAKQRQYVSAFDPTAVVPHGLQYFTEPFLDQLVSQKHQRLTDDAQFHAVPTALEDEKTAAKRKAYFMQLAFEALTLTSFFVPALGQVMLGVTVFQLGFEVFEGLEAWGNDDREQALGYLMDVAENVALIAALSGAGAAVEGAGGTPALERIPVETPSFIEELETVELPNGETRLWKPDLTPFAHDIVLPAGLTPDEFGLYHYQGKTWLALQDKVYSVKPLPSSEDYCIEHPTKALGYTPSLRHNGAGAWQHALDRPQQWEGSTLLKRLLPQAGRLSEQSVQRVLRVSDCHEAVLRQALSDNQRAPALLEDTLHRFLLDQAITDEFASSSSHSSSRISAFQARYQVVPDTLPPARALISQRYPQLPAPIADEVVRHASAAEMELMRKGTIAPRIAMEVRSYQQQVRLARAYEGLYLDSVRNPDTDILVLHTLQTLPGWSPEVRIELRQGSFLGALIGAIGPDDAAMRKVLARHAGDYQAYDASGLELHGRDQLYAALLHALPDEQRAALGFPGVWDGAKLKQAIEQRPLLTRHKLRQALAMQPVVAGHKSPMRLADGRSGYALSGKGTLPGFIARDTLLDMIRWLELPREGQSAEALLDALENLGLNRHQIHTRLTELLTQRSALEADLTSWGETSSTLVDLDRRTASRSRIQAALWQQWYDSNLPEMGRTASPLRLERVLLIDFPARLPDFFLQRVQGLQLIDVDVNTSGMPDSVPQQVNDLQTVDRFYRLFGHLTSLEIGRDVVAPSRNSATHDLYRISRCFPALRELRLVNLNIHLSALEFDQLRSLTQLQYLDLSGNNLRLVSGQDVLHGLSLRFLGLDHTGLEAWPNWLNEAAVSRLGHLSLRNNHISAIPDALVDDTAIAPPHTLVSLEGNFMSLHTILRTTLRDNATNGRYTFNVDVTPSIQNIVDHHLRQYAELSETLDNWAHASTSAMPLSEQTTHARVQVGNALLAHLRRVQVGETNAPLRLAEISLSDFPARLPSSYFAQIHDLQLIRVSATPAQLDHFLGQFSALSGLTLEGHIQPLEALPGALTSLRLLQRLNLCEQGLLVDQHAIDTFASLPNLNALVLDGNRIGAIVDASGLSRTLRSLSLVNTGLHTWPQWVEQLFPLYLLELDDNQIIELPEHILYNPRSDVGHTEISLTGNPLSEDTMYRAHTSENGRRAYSFNMDLPASIANEHWRDRHSSDSESESHSDSDSDTQSTHSDTGSNSEGHVHNPTLPFAQNAANVEDWLLGTVEENQAHQLTWDALVAGADAPDLLALTDRLTQSAPYRTQATRADFAARLWHVLEIASANAAERQLFNVMAQEATTTCADGAWLIFNQMEIRVFTEQALRDIPSASRGSALYRLTQRLYRLQELDDIARAQAGTRDQAEVRLAYRVHWAQALELPLPPSSMLYRAVASIRKGELDEALAQVQRGEHAEPFLRYAAQRDFWIEYLKETHASRFKQLEEDYQARVLAVTDQYPGQTVEQLQPEYDRLQEEHERNMTRLIRELTLASGHEYA